MFASLSMLLIGLVASSAQEMEVKGKYCAVNNVFHPHETDNTKFYVCTNYELVLFNCPAGLVWDAYYSTCAWPQGGGAGPEVPEVPSTPGSCSPSAPVPVCPEHDPNARAVHLAHQYDCTKFYTCSWGTPYLSNCPATLHFNPKLQVCDYPERAGCICNK